MDYFCIYYGKSYAGVTVSYLISIEIDGVTKNVSFVYFTEIISDSPTRNLINLDKQTEGYKITYRIVVRWMGCIMENFTLKKLL